MADNTTIDNGELTDYTVADEELSDGSKLQSVELYSESAGTKTKLGTTSNPIQVADAGGALTVDGTVTVTEPVSVDDNGSSLTVDNAALSVVGGGTEATAMRVTVANNSTGVLSVDDNGGSLTVDGTVGLAAGTNNVGDVDVASVPAPLSTTGGGTEAAAQRVTIANDSTGVVSVDDNGGSLTVDGTVTVTEPVSVDDNGGSLTVDGSVTATLAAADNAVGRVKITDGTDVADVLDLTNSNPVVTALVDADGTQITSFGGGTQYTEGDTDATITGTAMLWEDAADTLEPVSSASPLPVNVVAGAAAGGTSATDEAAYTPTSSAGTPIMGAADETAPDAAAEGTLAIVRSTLNRALHVNLRDADGAEVAVGGGTQYDEDTASAAADKLTMAGVVRKDAAATLVDTDGDRSQMQVDGTGYLWTRVGPALPAGTNNIGDVDVLTLPSIPAGTNNIGDVDVLTVPAPLSTTGGGTEATAQRVTIANDSTGVLSVDDNGSTLSVDDGAGSLTVDNAVLSVVGGGTEAAAQRVTLANDSTGVLSVDDNGGSLTIDGTVTANQGTAGTAWEVIGDVAHDAAAPANPVVVGGQMETMADSAPGSRAGTDGDATKLATTDGAVYAIPSGPQTWSYHSDGSSALTDATVHAAPGAGLSLYVTSIICSSGAATAMNIFFEEGASKVLGPWYLEAVAGRGLAITFGTPKKITANTALTVTTSAAIAHSVDVTGFIAPG